MQKLIIGAVALLVAAGALFAITTLNKDAEVEEALQDTQELLPEEQVLPLAESDVTTPTEAAAEAVLPSMETQPPSTATEEMPPQQTGAERPQGGGADALDLTSAAAALGVSEAELTAALGSQEQGRPDFASAAATLGVTEEALMEAIGMPEGGMPPGGGSRPGGAR